MTGNRIIDIILGAFSIITAVLVIYIFYISSETLFNRSIPENQKELEKLRRESLALSFPRTYDLRKIVVNIKSKSKRLRFLEIDMHITPYDDMDTEKLETNKYILRDEIITLAGSMYPNELNTVSGKLVFEEKIKQRFNDALASATNKKKTIRKIYFTKFVVQ
ncbi:MAG: flagellar basal body-associated FliL family protein [Bdellovibrionales bacterium]|nr:flagellar basal body-associated FliL family protein [Bdellovibrionales bacterium]